MTLVIGSGGGGGGKGGGGGGGGNEAKDNLDSKQFARILEIISEGEIEGLVDDAKSIFLNNTPLQAADGTYNFKDVTYSFREGTSNQTVIPITQNVSTTKPTALGTIVEDTPGVVQISDTDVDAVKVIISIPALQELNDDGDIVGRSVKFEIAVQYSGGSYSNVVSGNNGTISGRTGDLYEKEFLINLSGNFPVNIKVTRITEDSTSSKISDLIQWNNYVEIKYDQRSYPNTSLVGMRIDAEQFTSIPGRKYLIKGIKVKVPHNASVRADGSLSYSGVFNGTLGAAVWTSDPAWCLYDLLTSSRYGLGNHLDPTKLDKFAFYTCSQYCSELIDDGTGTGQTEPRFSCNVSIQTPMEAYDLVNQMCSVFRAMPYWNAGALTLSQDAPKDSTYVFSIANVLEPGFTYANASQKKRSTVAVVKYMDNDLRDINYEQATDSANLARYGSVIKQISAFACTSRGQAARLARWLLYMENVERETISFSASLDAGVIIRPGQIIEVADPVRAGDHMGGRIKSATTSAVTVDNIRDVTYLSVNAPWLHVILPDGRHEKREVTGISSNVISVSPAFSEAPLANGPWVYETTTTADAIQTSLWRVVSIEEQENGVHAISALQYNPGKFAHIESGLALAPRDVTNLDQQPVAPTNLSGLEVIYESTGIARVKIQLSWTSSTDNTYVRWRFEEGNWTGVTVEGSNNYEILDTVVGKYYIEVYSVSASGLRSAAPAKLDPFNAVGKTAPPQQVSGVSLLPIDQASAILSWDRATELDVLLGGKVLIRHSVLTTNAIWKDAQEIVVAATGSQTQKQVPNLTGTYLLKFEDDGGRVSPTPGSNQTDWDPTRAVNTLPEPTDRLTVQTIDEHTPNFAGSKTNTVYDSGLDALKLTETNSQAAASGEYTFNTSVDLTHVYDVNIQRRITAASYQIGSLWDSRTTLLDTWGNIDDVGSAISADKCNASVWVRATNDNPSGSPTYGAWNEVSNVLIRGRAFQFKAKLTSGDTDQNIAITALGAVLELQGRTETTPAGSPISSGSSAKAVTFARAFKETPSLAITALGQQSGDFYEITSESRTGFTITFKNGSSAVARSFYYSASGHGKEIT